MQIEFEVYDNTFTAEVRYKPEIPARRTGHPDNWDEGEGEELEFVTLKENGVRMMVFLYTAEELKGIEDAAYRAARICHNNEEL